ncbi:hypothetical protein GCM10027280_62060 [Micromonospora polyrhachis]|uniref:Uncharacterized protein n=1 Tax=Micromonospora polyrhachis TaxID=1282883 RepID=A0A7W7STA9_9ACTN|nr:hypothetical protein [Micromonospora polyrhachis]MBB4960176.1 hypothetical protein [Micromonospora polyrhachis]
MDDSREGGMKRRVSYEEYLSAAAMTFARRHRPLPLAHRCTCGADLPCQARHRIPISREHWPTPEEQK